MTRRQLLVAAGTAPVAAWFAAPAAPAASAAPSAAKPIVLADDTERTYGPVMLIGDSTAGGSVGGLRDGLIARRIGPFRCDIQGSRSIARESRKFPSGVAAVRSARAAGFDPRAWVVALGANDMWFIGRKVMSAATLIDTLVGEIGADRHVVFVNQWSTKGGSFPILNEALAEARRRWPLLLVGDWATAARAHPEWHSKDGVHYSKKGVSARNTFLSRAMVLAARAAGDVRVPVLPRPGQVVRG